MGGGCNLRIHFPLVGRVLSIKNKKQNNCRNPINHNPHLNIFTRKVACSDFFFFSLNANKTKNIEGTKKKKKKNPYQANLNL